jgi:hypothetical protein
MCTYAAVERGCAKPTCLHATLKEQVLEEALLFAHCALLFRKPSVPILQRTSRSPSQAGDECNINISVEIICQTLAVYNMVVGKLDGDEGTASNVSVASIRPAHADPYSHHRSVNSIINFHSFLGAP